VPRYARQVDRALGEPLPLDAVPLRFGSWIGGDRDGNPNVTPEITRKATWMARWVAADLYARDVDALRTELSIGVASDELRDAAGNSPEPYRAVLREVAARLRVTRSHAAAQIEGPDREAHSSERPFLEVSDLAAPLLLCHGSLVPTGNELLAAGRLRDILRRVAVFGLTLAPLDLRQTSARHGEVVAWIARQWNLGSYEDATENERVAILLREIESGTRTLADLHLAANGASEAMIPDSVRDVVEVFETAAALPGESLGAYVITMAGRASDVLAVELLQKLAGTRHPQRVVPLFETTHDLERAGDVLDALFQLPWYRARIAGHQEVMVGYSDSAKDAGRFAAAWALYRAQEQIVGLPAAPRSPDAVPRPRRQRGARRRSHPPGYSIVATRLSQRAAARHRTGRDDSGQIRPDRHRRPDDGGLHDSDTRSDAWAGATARAGVARRDGPAVGTRALVVSRGGVRRSAISRVLSFCDARA
jgi:phosphoenolpyruvate carboxylase